MICQSQKIKNSIQIQPNQIQSEEAQHGIQLAFTILPALASLLVAAVMLRYTLKQKRVQQISEALEQYS